MSKAIIGLDGLDPRDIPAFEFPGEWDQLKIETTVHTAPSWTAIFSGINPNEELNMFDHWKVPNKVPEEPDMMAKNSDEKFTYEEIEQDSFLWNMFDVEVVSAPILNPTFSTLDDHPGQHLTWCSEPEEFEEAMEVLTDLTLEYENVITVYPLPDKINHIRDNPKKGYYGDEDRNRHMSELVEVAEELMDAFDEWIFISDHGWPSDAEWATMSYQLPSHDPIGVIQSNVYDTEGYTNITVHDLLVEFLED